MTELQSLASEFVNHLQGTDQYDSELISDLEKFITDPSPENQAHVEYLLNTLAVENDSMFIDLMNGREDYLPSLIALSETAQIILTHLAECGLHTLDILGSVLWAPLALIVRNYQIWQAGQSSSLELVGSLSEVDATIRPEFIPYIPNFVAIFHARLSEEIISHKNLSAEEFKQYFAQLFSQFRQRLSSHIIQGTTFGMASRINNEVTATWMILTDALASYDGTVNREYLSWIHYELALTSDLLRVWESGTHFPASTE